MHGYETTTEGSTLSESEELLEDLVTRACPPEVRSVLRAYLVGDTTFATFQQQWAPYNQPFPDYFNRYILTDLRNTGLVLCSMTRATSSPL